MSNSWLGINMDDLNKENAGQVMLITAWYRACQWGQWNKADKIYEKLKRLWNA